MAGKLALANLFAARCADDFPPAGIPTYVDIFKGREESARARLHELAHKDLSGVKYELLVDVGIPIDDDSELGKAARR